MKRTLILLAAALGGCNLNLMDSPGQVLNRAYATPVATGSFPKPWYLYYEGLSYGDWVGGTAFYIWNSSPPAGDAATFYSTLKVDMSATEKPLNGLRHMKLSYDGPGIPSSIWGGGMGVIHASSYLTYPSTPGRDLRPGAYTKCVFYAASPQGRKVGFVAQGIDIGLQTLTPEYQRFQINLPPVSSQSAVKDFFNINLDASQTLTPLTLYIDDLRYE